MRSSGFHAFAVLCISLLLAACGGGGGNDSAPATVSGRVSFDKAPFAPSPAVGLDYGAIIDAPARGVVVEAISASDRTTILTTTNTDANGNYSLTFQSGVSFFVRAKAQMLRAGTPSWNFRVLNNTNSNALYAMDSADFVNDGSVRNLRAASGWGGAGYTTTRTAAPFSVLDAVYEAFNLVLGANANAQFPPLDLYWSPQNISADGNPLAGEIGTTSYHNVAGGGFQPGIYILGAENVDTDEYDLHVIAHEWGHYFQDAFSRDDSLGGGHGLTNLLDLRVAFSEGWGNAFSAMSRSDPHYRDSSGSGQGQDFTVNMEQNTTSGQSGWFNEASLQSILYDLYDSAMDGVDAVALGFTPIYQVMASDLPATEAFSSVFSFITALKARQPMANIDPLVMGQNIRSVDIDAYGSTETNGGNDPANNLPVYRSITINGPLQNVCSRTANGEYNKLGNRRFLRFTVPANQQVTFRAVGPAGSDPDMVLHRRGILAVAESTVNGAEEFSRNLEAGPHVLEVYDFFATDNAASPSGNTCIDVTLRSP